MRLAFLCDENVPRLAVGRLREAGFDIHWIGEIARGATDRDVLALAQLGGRVLITFDKDFGELAARHPGIANQGVILFRPKNVAPALLPAWIAAQIVARTDWPGHFSVIEEDRIRMRPLK